MVKAMKKTQDSKTILCSIALWLGGAISVAQAGDNYVWIEGEKPATVTPADFKTPVGPGLPKVLSGGQWLSLIIPSEKVEKEFPGESVTFAYQATIPAAADYEVWLHIGLARADRYLRSTFDWRIDQGAWKSSGPREPTIDAQQGTAVRPVAWLNLGKQTLAAGAHTLEFRITKTKATDGKFASVEFSLDAICLTTKPFHPLGPVKPGDTSWMGDADKSAVTQTFEVANPVPAAQTALSLAGIWQYTADGRFG